METYGIYEDMANRTSGAVYIGVVGPVRTGKSTFIKRFMETLVLPHAETKDRVVMTDELPQSSPGKTVMTTEPKFVPAAPAEIVAAKGAKASVRLVDCVGFPVAGASGFEEEGSPRLVSTPWDEAPIPFEKAAEIGTRRVIREHSTVGVLVTTDGSFSAIGRDAYEPAEELTVKELKEIGKPFVVLLNCVEPTSAEGLREKLEKKYGVTVVAMNVENATESELLYVLQKVLLEFPVTRIDVKIPAWLQSLPMSASTVKTLVEKVKELVHGIVKMKDCAALEEGFLDEEGDFFPVSTELDLGSGSATLTLNVKEGVFYRVLSEACGEEIEDDLTLLRLLRTLSEAGREYGKIKDAFVKAKEGGYGVVAPAFSELELAQPKLVKRGANYGVRFQADGDSYHIVKVNVRGEVEPIVGGKEQGETFLNDTLEKFSLEPAAVWETNVFGRTLKEMLETEILRKAEGMPPTLRGKMSRTLGRIVNEGKGGFFCILL
ncbi:MAG: stage IV sporulation protein A [Clostridia bacterium]|nr:stage IV sporulation protein A [Clostridia bacterium]